MRASRGEKTPEMFILVAEMDKGQKFEAPFWYTFCHPQKIGSIFSVGEWRMKPGRHFPCHCTAGNAEDARLSSSMDKAYTERAAVGSVPHGNETKALPALLKLTWCYLITNSTEATGQTS